MCLSFFRGVLFVVFPILIIVSCTNPIKSQTSIQVHRPEFDEEFVGPFDSWGDAKIEYGAIGDGQSDDTEALQKAIDKLGTPNNPSVLYLPQGTYMITQPLRIKYKTSISIIGEDPSKTIIKWGGNNGGKMIIINGLKHAQFSRITWDGNHTAQLIYQYKWDGKANYGTTGNDHSDEVYKNVAIGIKAGDITKNFMESEINISRGHFIDITEAGISIESQNALNWFIWDSEFINCKNGIRKIAGNFYVYQSQFSGSSNADIEINGAQFVSIRHNISINSASFLKAGYSGDNLSGVTIQGNFILDPTSSPVIDFPQIGPVILMDNVFKTRNLRSPIIQMDKVPTDLIMSNNIFTISNPLKLHSGARTSLHNSQIVPYETLNISLAPLPATPVSRKREIFEINSSMNADSVQVLVNEICENFSGQRPVVHIHEDIVLNKSIVIPTNCDIQIIGDGRNNSYASFIGPPNKSIFIFQGPSRATIRNLHLTYNSDSNSGDALVFREVDQNNSRIFIDQYYGWDVKNISLQVDNLERAKVEMRSSFQGGNEACIRIIKNSKSTGSSVNLFGANPGGTLKRASGSMFDLRNGNLLVLDSWYEGWAPGYKYLNGKGNFTLQGSHIEFRSVDERVPVTIDGFSGKASFLFTNMLNGLHVKENPSSKILGLGLNSWKQHSFKMDTSISQMAYIFNASFENALIKEENKFHNVTSDSQKDFIEEMLQQIRSNLPSDINQLAENSSDIRIFRLSIDKAKTGIDLKATLGAEPDAPNLPWSPFNTSNNMFVSSSEDRICVKFLDWDTTSVMGCEFMGRKLIKINQSGWGNAGALSLYKLKDGEYVETTIEKDGKGRVIGLTSSDQPGYTLESIPYAINIAANGILYLREYGNSVSPQSSGYPFNTGDRVRIAIEYDSVRYYHNQTLLHTSVIKPEIPLSVIVSFNHTGANVNNVTVKKNNYPITFTANIENASAVGKFQWKLNGLQIVNDSPFYTPKYLHGRDIVFCIISYENDYLVSNEIRIKGREEVCP